MIAYYKEYQKYEDFIKEGNNVEALVDMAKKAYYTYRDTDTTYDYAIIEVKGYRCLTKILGERGLIASRKDIFIKDIVQPFDSERLYPIQLIKKEFDWV